MQVSLVYPQQTVPAVDLTASVVGLKYVILGSRHVYDCSLIGKGFNCGDGSCTHPERPRTYIWTKRWKYPQLLHCRQYKS